ncbi:MAG TPA: hypothetical protein VJV75_03730 [Candidatus Polarisedimenticolia bacterium]|nr:hypothetical protein [Candidatus Polarisedimenticolia bacterium]
MRTALIIGGLVALAALLVWFTRKKPATGLAGLFEGPAIDRLTGEFTGNL